MPVTNFAIATRDSSQNPRIWQGKDAPARRRQRPVSYEVTARAVKFLGKREGNGSAPIG